MQEKQIYQIVRNNALLPNPVEGMRVKIHRKHSCDPWVGETNVLVRSTVAEGHGMLVGPIMGNNDLAWFVQIEEGSLKGLCGAYWLDELELA